MCQHRDRNRPERDCPLHVCACISLPVPLLLISLMLWKKNDFFNAVSCSCFSLTYESCGDYLCVEWQVQSESEMVGPCVSQSNGKDDLSLLFILGWLQEEMLEQLF
ncbi:hypothetical protein AMECASPLE_030021 [Ameca splendens]|uniref:Uncharacterized protein n=1 Tax=Ameca splendens TaxID=208324 RepID=A0ABV0Z3T1_9TELE